MWLFTKSSKFLVSILLLGLISACAPTGSKPPETTALSSQTPTATASPTEVPPTPTPTPTVSLPVGNLTPVPTTDSAITSQNVTQIQEVARYYGDIDYTVKLTTDGRFLFVLDHMGVTKYDYPSMKELGFVAIPNKTLDFQISRDGSWWLIQDFPDTYLIYIEDSLDNPEIWILEEHIKAPYLMNLSPDGKMLSATETFSSSFRTDLISTEDFTILFSFFGSIPGPAAFSSDGRLFAQGNLLPGGTGGSVQIYNLIDFSHSESLPVRHPFIVSTLAFSHDSNFLAVREVEALAIHSLSEGTVRTRITDLCTSLSGARVGFASDSSDIVFENSQCSTGRWQLNDEGARLLDGTNFSFPRSVYTGNGEAIHIPYPKTIEPTFKPYVIPRPFLFPVFMEFTENSSILFDTAKMATDVLRYEGGYHCGLDITSSSLDCETYNPERSDGWYIVVDTRILGADGKFYSVVQEDSEVKVTSLEQATDVIYTIPFNGSYSRILHFDPVTSVIIYQDGRGMIVIQDMQTQGTIARWQDSYIWQGGITASQDGRYIALCKTSRPGEFWSYRNSDELLIFDTTEKGFIRQLSYDCSATSMAFSPDGSVLAVYSYFVKDSTRVSRNSQDFRNGVMGSRITLLTTSLPYQRNYIETDINFGAYYYLESFAIAFSSDNSVLAVSCGKGEICFVDVIEQEIIHRISAQTRISHLAFSRDGHLLAALSHWGTLSLFAVDGGD